MGVDGVWHTRYLLPFQQGTLLGFGLEPTAAGHEIDVLVFEHTAFLLPDGGREVVAGATAGQQPTMMALRGEMTTAERDMADGGGGPDIVHGPHHRLATAQNLTDAT